MRKINSASSLNRNTLLVLLRGALCGGALSDSFAEPVDWDGVLELAHFHGLTPALRAPIARMADNIPAAVAENVDKAYQATRTRNAFRFLGAASLIQEFLRRGIEVVVLKGAHLAFEAYGDIGLRPMGDVDVLIKSRDLRRCMSIAEQHVRRLGNALGLRPRTARSVWHMVGTRHVECRFRWHGFPVNVEIHWCLFPLMFTWLLKYNEKEIWEHAEPFDFCGVKTNALSACHALAYLCFNAYKDGVYTGRIEWVKALDVAHLVSTYESQMDWEYFLRLCQEKMAAAIALPMLKSVQQSLASQVPLSVLQALEELAGGVRTLAPTLCLPTHELELPEESRALGRSAGEYYARLERLPGLGYRLRSLLVILIPTDRYFLHCPGQLLLFLVVSWCGLFEGLVGMCGGLLRKAFGSMCETR